MITLNKLKDIIGAVEKENSITDDWYVYISSYETLIITIDNDGDNHEKDIEIDLEDGEVR